MPQKRGRFVLTFCHTGNRMLGAPFKPYFGLSGMMALYVRLPV
jgi:hypothetical protein